MKYQTEYNAMQTVIDFMEKAPREFASTQGEANK